MSHLPVANTVVLLTPTEDISLAEHILRQHARDCYYC